VKQAGLAPDDALGFSVCVRARYVRATTNAARARVSPLPTFQGGKEKNRFDVSIERTRAPAAFSRLVLSGSARECQVGTPNPQSGVNFFFSSPTLGGETETHTNASRKNKKGRGESSSSASWCEQARTIFRETSNYRAREWTLFATRERRVPDRETRRTRVRVARRRKHPREGAHFGRVRSNAARAESQPTRFRRCSFFLLSRRPAFRGNRHPATRPGGGRDEGSETRSVARDSDARALTDHTPRSRSPPRRTETRLRVRGPNALGLEKRRANNDRQPTVSTR
jgi:hypothetical protein